MTHFSNSLKTLLIFILFSINLLFNVEAQQKSDPTLITISTDELSMIFGINSAGTLMFHHFGNKINDPSAFLIKKSYRRSDYGTDPEGFSTNGGRNFREPALRITHSDGDLNTELIYQSHTQRFLEDSNVQETVISLKDRKLPLLVNITVNAFQKENVFTQSVRIENQEQSDVVLHNYYSMYLPVKAERYFLNSFAGDWAKEMGLEENQLTHGIKSIESKKGMRTTRTENPSFLLSLNAPMDENYGEVIGGALAWSGNYKLNFELDEFGVLNISAGINPFASEYHLKNGETFVTPKAIFTYSTVGAGGVSRRLHDWARNYGVYDPLTIRPTLLNSWEGAYFDFDEKTITDMVDDASDMGLELFVLDDGWFGNNYPRNGSGAGLGDWQVNIKKLPRGIDYIASYTSGKGLKFGIWIEPEMVNPKSDLAIAHPDWIVKSNGRDMPTIRNQWLLDLSNPEVQDFVFSVFDNVMQQSSHISYVKWDANRHAESVGSAYLNDNRQSHFWIDYTKGFYKVLERIRVKYPQTIIQTCASGGGRVDYGALKYTQEVWTSDNTDALSRIFIQYGTNFIYPAIVTGSNVSAVPNHQTNNVTPLKFRFDVAMSGRLGMELQPKDMNEEDRGFAKQAIADYKSIRDLVMFGDLYRIASPYDNQGYYSLSYVGKDKKRAVVYGYCISYRGRGLTPKFKLRGLDPNKRYLLKEINKLTDKSNFWGDGQIFSGQYLIEEGINPHLQKMYDSAVFSLVEVE